MPETTPSPKDRRAAITKLTAEDADTVREAVTTLLAAPLDTQSELALCQLVADWETQESPASLWAAVILGKQQSAAAVKPLLDVLTGDEDYVIEAALEALVQIATAHGEAVLPPLAEFWLEYVGNDDEVFYPYVADALVALAKQGSETAERLLLYAVVVDESMRFSLVDSITDLGKPEYLPILHRLLLVATAYRDEFTLNELYHAYGKLSGQITSEPFPSLLDKPWEERWGHLLEQLGKSEEEMDTMIQERLEKLRSFREVTDTAPPPASEQVTLPDFSITEYLAVRPRTGIEEEFARTMRLLGASEQWSVEVVQEQISGAADLQSVLTFVSGALPEFPSEQSFAEFAEQLNALWNVTPRADLGWLTPQEKSVEFERREWNDTISARKKELRAKFLEE